MLWLNGRLLDPDHARLDPADRGFTLGDGVFETIAARGGAARDLDRHLARLREGAKVLGFASPYDDAAISDAVAALLGASGLMEAALRITLSRGPAARGLLPPEQVRPTLMITAAPLPTPPAPAKAVIARITCRNEFSPLSRIKSLNYLDNIVARQEAQARGGDEAILLNTQGRVAEASIANLFAVINGQLVTPPVSEGALPGIRRGLLIEQGLVTEQPVTVAALTAATEIFLTSSLGVRAVVSVDGVPVGDGMPGPAFRALAFRVS